MTDAERLALWDDELEQLITQAAALYGDETVSAAVNHALRQLIANRTAHLSFSDIKAAMKLELRRLITPH